MHTQMVFPVLCRDITELGPEEVVVVLVGPLHTKLYCHFLIVNLRVLIYILFLLSNC